MEINEPVKSALESLHIERCDCSAQVTHYTTRVAIRGDEFETAQQRGDPVLNSLEPDRVGPSLDDSWNVSSRLMKNQRQDLVDSCCGLRGWG
jgi:hypothetical protein